MGEPLRVLLVGSSEREAEILVGELERGGFAVEYRIVPSPDEFAEALHEGSWDISLCDYHAPEIDAENALEHLFHLDPDLPCIVLSKTIGEDIAVKMMELGARDYILKDNLFLLAPAVRRELRDVEERRRRREAESLLRESEARFRAISESAEDAIYLLGEGMFLFVNPKFCEMLEISPEEACSPGFDFMSLVAPGSEGIIEERIRRVQEGKEVSPRYEFTAISTGGRKFEVEASVSYIEIEGKLTTLGILRDISERKRAETAIRESEARFRAISESAQDAIITIDDRQVIHFWNDAATRIFGYSSDEAVGREIHDLIMPAKYLEGPNPRIREFLENRNDAAAGNTIELTALRKGGEEFPVELSVAFFETDHKRYAIGILRDISERKRAEKNLRESEESYHSLFDNSPDAIYIQDRQGRFLDVNRGACEMYGYPREFFIGKTPEPLSAPGRNDMEAVMAHLEKAFAGEPQRFEFWGISADGQVFPKDVLLFKSRYFGREVVIAFARDITARKEAERALRLTQFSVDHSADAAFWMGPDAKFIYVNDAACRSLGYSRDELLSLTVHDIDPNFPVERWPEHWEEIKRRGSFSIESHHRTKDGRVFPVELMLNFIEFEGKEYNIALARDISERKQAEKDREQFERELNQQFHLSQIGLLTSGIAHNLRNPLSLITMQASLMQNILDNACSAVKDGEECMVNTVDVKKTMDRILHAADRINEIIDELMSYHQMNQETGSDRVDVNRVIRSDAAILKADFDLKYHVSIQLELSKSPLWTKADARDIGQIFLNLVSNARDAMQKSQNRIMTIRSGSKRKQGFVWFEVADTGGGIPKSILDRLGEPFVTSKARDAEAKKHGSGTGLGFYMIQRILNRIGGRFEVDSREGDTRIRILLPASG